MKNYKKIVTTIIVAFTIVFVLSGCQKKDSKESDSTEKRIRKQLKSL